MSPFQTFNQLPCLVEGGCLAYSQGLNSTVASQSLDRILPLWLANPCNPAMSSHFRQLSYWWNSGRKKNKGWEGEDAKAITPQTAALMLNEELKDPSSVQSYHVRWACTYMGLIAGCSWTTKLLSLWNGWLLSFWTVLLLITLQTMIVILPNIWNLNGIAQTIILKSELLSSQNFNSVYIKLIFPTIKILNVIIPNIGIFALILELLEYRSCPCKHWNYHVILEKTGILILSFQTLELWPYPSKHWNTYITHPNFGILALSFQTLKIHFQTFEFWPFPLKHLKTDLAPPNFGILAYILPIIAFIILSFQTLEFIYPSKHWNSYCLTLV